MDRWIPPLPVSSLENILHTLNGRSLDYPYLVVNHMEPDHCASIEELLLRYPNLKVVGNDKTPQAHRSSSMTWI